jgi:hypothetical protein
MKEVVPPVVNNHLDIVYNAPYQHKWLTKRNWRSPFSAKVKDNSVDVPSALVNRGTGTPTLLYQVQMRFSSPSEGIQSSMNGENHAAQGNKMESSMDVEYKFRLAQERIRKEKISLQNNRAAL